jgi:hypothetical protein
LHGADPSAARLDRCRARLAAAGATAQLHPQAPERLNLPMRYAAAFAGSCAFQRVAAPHAATIPTSPRPAPSAHVFRIALTSGTTLSIRRAIEGRCASRTCVGAVAHGDTRTGAHCPLDVGDGRAAPQGRGG